LPCFVVPAPPPRPTRFPYTTLFRSVLGGDRAHLLDGLGVGQRRFRGAAAAGAIQVELEQTLDHAVAIPASPCGHVGSLSHAGARDRKSTRLNSSHVSISYAVFCLKK